MPALGVVSSRKARPVCMTLKQEGRVTVPHLAFHTPGAQISLVRPEGKKTEGLQNMVGIPLTIIPPPPSEMWRRKPEGLKEAQPTHSPPALE